MSNIIHKKPYCSQRGAIMVFFTLLLPILFGFMGLGFDVSMLYVNKGKLQDVADAAALAGAAHIGEEGDGIKHAVEAFAKANGLLVTENELIEVVNDGWSGLSELGDTENVRVAYGVVTVNDRPRLRVRIDKRVLMPFISVLLPDLEKGMPVVAVAAAEGETGDEPVFRIIGRNGVYDHFFNLSGSRSEGDPDKWIKGSIYAGNMLRASYKRNHPQQARNMISVDGYIFADMLNTGLPLDYGVTGTSKKPSDDRIIRSDYVRKKDGDTCLSGFNALTPTTFKASGWNKTAKEMAEQKLASYSVELQGMIADKSIKQKAMTKNGNYRYMCNKAVKEELVEKGIEVTDLKFERIERNGKENTKWESRGPEETNHQYSNIEADCETIDVLYVEIQGDWKGQNLKDSREGAVWLGAYPKTNKLKEVGLLIVELKTEPNGEQKQKGLTADDLTGSFIITPGDNGCKFGAIYSQANLEIRAPYNQKDNGNCNSFTGPVFSEKFVSFSYDDKCAGGGRAHPHFGEDAVIAADVVLFGYGYEIGPNVVIDNDPKKYHMGTYYYDLFTNYKTDTSTTEYQKEWWKSGLKTVDKWSDSQSNQVFSLENFQFHDEVYLASHPEMKINEIKLLQELWQAIDCRDTEYDEEHNVKINLKGSLYGDFGRWPTEFDYIKEGSNQGSSIRNCTFEGREGTETVTTKLRLVE